MALWVPELALFGDELFTSHTPRLYSNPLLGLGLLGFGVLEIVVGVWAIVIFLKALGQVQGFSAWKALGNTLLASLVVLVPLALFVVLAVAAR
jgi:hypothetical protein